MIDGFAMIVFAAASFADISPLMLMMPSPRCRHYFLLFRYAAFSRCFFFISPVTLYFAALIFFLLPFFI